MHRAHFAFVAACCVRPDARRDTAVAEAAAGVTDWDEVLALARRHRVEGLVWDALHRAEIEAPSEAMQILRERAAVIAQESLHNAALAVRIRDRLAAGGVASLALKGPSLEVLAWGRLGLKDAWDIDVLVSPTDVDPAVRLLLQDGYQPTQPPDLTLDTLAEWTVLSKECALIHPATGAVVELHWRVADSPRLGAGLSLAGPSREVHLAGGLSLTTFADRDLYAYLCIHGAGHAWSRLKWLADLAAWLEQKSAGEIETLHRQAQMNGVGACSAQALLLCRRHLGLTLSEAFCDGLGRPVKVRWLLAVAEDALIGGGVSEILDRPLTTEKIQLSQILLGEGWGYVWSELARQGVSIHDRRRIPLPKWLHPLYGLIRLPSWLWRRIRP